MKLPYYLTQSDNDYEELYSKFLKIQKLDKVNLQLQSVNISINLINKVKNRYSNVLPYDKTLINKDEYINGSIITPFTSKSKLINYIATQGPLKNTVIEFWKMCLKFNNCNIVMLTDIFEAETGREKCFDYIKNLNRDLTNIFTSQNVIIDNIEVEIKQLAEVGIEVRTIKIFLQDGGIKIINHYWIKSWPDFSTPNEKIDVIEICKLIEKRRVNDEDPLIVHCSAGVGRTGTFIAIDYFLKECLTAKFSEFEDPIFEIVKNMRNCRMMMVQRFEQFKFIYYTIKRYLVKAE